ncbi:SARP family transcriptional regulator [Paractinoplanes deccanensis]|uniref:SARP family transcriptional regulator n=1 Tax=Paractinoplanes deccanensis TaxID=113561 RepID=A0ABQ3YLT5_9ACTN|nr:BTAD domain-containing putative transcriptional regulator [Actinoplanes deccanensis]GID80971.1 SARP family transcriptional regulator [Actinoplanes deccanensis]
MIEFRLLGPVEAWVGDRRVEVGQPRQRAVLAVLAADAGRAVATDVLIDRLWGETPPPTARRSLHAHVTRVRRALEEAGGQATLARRSGGYLLDTDPGRVDLHRMRDLLGRSRRDGCSTGERVTLLREAATLWRGEPLTGIGGPWADRMRHSWRQDHLDLMLAWARAEIAAGNPGVVSGRLSELAAENPLAEPLSAELIRALHLAGRPTEALERYTEIRERLREELGVDPSPELQTLQRTILRQQEAASVVPAQLPADVAGFAGRGDQLAQLDALPRETGTAVIVAISGTAGVGKTTFAVHWARAAAPRFPDGQLYVDLRGFDPRGRALEPGQALRGFLNALGVPPARVPSTIQAQVGLYRSLLDGKRVLILLDNARDADQVRDLLPVTSTALALVTSRDQLVPLLATHGAHPAGLGALSPGEALELLTHRLGEERVTAEPAAATAIVTACAGLPLALAIAAARARHSGFPLTALAAELTDAGQRLDALDAGDAPTRLGTVFSWSYAALSTSAARLFRLLGTHPDPGVSAAAAASFAGRPVPEVRRDLVELVRANMLVERAPGRYTFHDLLRVYAAELAAAEETGEQRHTTMSRLLDHYVHTAHAATMLLDPAQGTLDLGSPRSGVVLDPPVKEQEALDWFEAERPALLAAVRHAAEGGFETAAWQLTVTLVTFLDWQGYWHDLETAARLAVAAARDADAPTLARAHRHVSTACLGLNRFDDAETALRKALGVSAPAGDTTGQAFAYNGLAAVEDRRDRPGHALPHARRALELFEAAGHRIGQAVALSSVGWYQALLGELPGALVSCRRALTLLEDLGDRYGQAHAWDSLGYIHHRLGRHPEAVDCYQQAVALFTELGDRYQEADTTSHLGDAHLAAGDTRAAHEAWRHALTVLDELDHPSAEPLRAKLAAT